MLRVRDMPILICSFPKFPVGYPYKIMDNAEAPAKAAVQIIPERRTGRFPVRETKRPFFEG